MNTMKRSILFLSAASIFISSCTAIKEANNSLPDDTYYSLEEAAMIKVYNRDHPINNQPISEKSNLEPESITTNPRASAPMDFYNQPNTSTSHPSFMDSINSIQPNYAPGTDNFNLSGTNYITNNYGIDPNYSTRLRSYYAPTPLSLSYYDPFYGGSFFNAPFYGSSFGLNYGYGGIGLGIGLNYGYNGFFSPYNYGYGGFYGCNPYYYNAFYNPFYNPYGCFGNYGIYDYCTTGVYYTGRIRTNTIYGPRTRGNSREESYTSGGASGTPNSSPATATSITTNRNAINGGTRGAESQKNAFFDNLIRGGNTTTNTGAPTRRDTYMSGPNKGRSTNTSSPSTPASTRSAPSTSSPNNYQAPARGSYQPAPSRQSTQQFSAPVNTNPTPSYSAPSYSAPSRSSDNNSGGSSFGGGGGRSSGGAGNSSSNGGGGRRGR